MMILLAVACSGGGDDATSSPTAAASAGTSTPLASPTSASTAAASPSATATLVATATVSAATPTAGATATGTPAVTVTPTETAEPAEAAEAAEAAGEPIDADLCAALAERNAVEVRFADARCTWDGGSAGVTLELVHLPACPPRPAGSLDAQTAVGIEAYLETDLVNGTSTVTMTACPPDGGAWQVRAFAGANHPAGGVLAVDETFGLIVTVDTIRELLERR